MKRIVGIDPTGSSYDRIEACPPSAALPQVFDGHPSDHRDRGTALHAFVHLVATFRRTEATPEQARAQALEEIDQQWRAACEQLDLAALRGRTMLSTEVAIAYNWREDTARILQPVAPRQYEIDPETETAQTLDALGVNVEARHGYVGDYKGPFGWLPPPERSLQLGGGALGIARIYKLRTADLEFIRLRSDGTSSPWHATLDSFGIENVAERIQGMMAAVVRLRAELAADRDLVPNVTEGPWCSYCPAKAHCPAKTQLVRSVLAGDGAKLSLREPITSENVGRVYQLVKKAKEGIRIAEKAIHAYERDGVVSTPDELSATAIPLGSDPDGARRYYGRFERPGNEQLDGNIVYAVLAEKFGPEVAAKACAMASTKDAIRDVVREHKAKDETLKAAEEAVLAEVRARGGSKHPPTDKATEFVLAPDGTAKKATRKKAS